MVAPYVADCVVRFATVNPNDPGDIGDIGERIQYRGSYDECVDYLRRWQATVQRRTANTQELVIVYVSNGMLASYVL